jgi:hypothetical protein
MKNVDEDFKDVEETDFMDDGVRIANNLDCQLLYFLLCIFPIDFALSIYLRWGTTRGYYI